VKQETTIDKFKKGMLVGADHQPVDCFFYEVGHTRENSFLMKQIIFALTVFLFKVFASLQHISSYVTRPKAFVLSFPSSLQVCLALCHC
jgi:hypothetical protein